jgi:hypothetical protein
VVLISQSAGLFLALLTAAASHSFSAPDGYLPWATGAGLAGAAAESVPGAGDREARETLQVIDEDTMSDAVDDPEISPAGR